MLRSPKNMDLADRYVVSIMSSMCSFFYVESSEVEDDDVVQVLVLLVINSFPPSCSNI